MINIIGNIFGTSGYSMHTRYLVNALGKLTRCRLSTSFPPDWVRYVNDLEMEMIKREEDFDINLIITHPVFWKTHLYAKRNFVYLIWEGDSVPSWIINECLNPKIEKIIVASRHTEQAILKSLHNSPTVFGDLLPKGMNFELNDVIIPKIKVIPHGVDLNIFKVLTNSQTQSNSVQGGSGSFSKEVVSQTASPTTDTFKFLANKGFRNLEDRGGIQYLIKAFFEEFRDDETVELILKINPAYGIPNLPQMFPEYKDRKANVRIIADAITNEELNKLYNECDVFVSPTRSETFNIPCLEAMACGKPVITTNFGGQTDYVTNENGWLIDGELTENTWELEYESVSWITPNMENLKKCLRMAYNNKQECLNKGQRALETSKQYTWENTAQKIKDLI